MQNKIMNEKIKKNPVTDWIRTKKLDYKKKKKNMLKFAYNPNLWLKNSRYPLTKNQNKCGYMIIISLY